MICQKKSNYKFYIYIVSTVVLLNLTKRKTTLKRDRHIGLSLRENEIEWTLFWIAARRHVGMLQSYSRGTHTAIDSLALVEVCLQYGHPDTKNTSCRDAICSPSVIELVYVHRCSAVVTSRAGPRGAALHSLYGTDDVRMIWEIYISLFFINETKTSNIAEANARRGRPGVTLQYSFTKNANGIFK